MIYDPNDPLIRKEIEFKLKSEYSVENIINRIKTELDNYYIEGPEKYFEKRPKPGVGMLSFHGDSEYFAADDYFRSYFTMGKCNVFAYIIYKVFEGYATAYSDGGISNIGDHIIVKVGNKFYDYNGEIKVDDKQEFINDGQYSIKGKIFSQYDIEHYINLYREEYKKMKNGDKPENNYVHNGDLPTEFDEELIKIGINTGRYEIYKNVYPEIENSEVGRSSR